MSLEQKPPHRVSYAPLKDVSKTMVWQLSRWRNDQAQAEGSIPPIPPNSITKPPSAELRPGQLDADSLPPYPVLDDSATRAELAAQSEADPIFGNWVKRNTVEHRVAGHRIVNLSLKATGYAPGDITDAQLELVADLADEFSFGEIRTTHQQNMVLADVRMDQLYSLWQRLQGAGLATPNHGYLTDMICCPGGDYCSLANAKSIPVAEAIQSRFNDLDYLYDLGPIELNISGCMNACGHHHIGHIGILGVDKKGEEFYQVCLGGSQAKDASIGKILGPSFSQQDMPEVIEKLLSTYLELREGDEIFLETYRRVGIEPFKERVYAKAD